MKRKFAWLPIRLSELRGKTWYYTNTRAWLEWVRVIDTVWGDRLFVAIDKDAP